MLEPKVSVVIPTYGGSDSLLRSINSVLAQNYSNFNIIVVDDNNPNSEGRKKTEKIISSFSSEKLIYIQHSKNKNGSAARNTGVANTDAKYICFLDDDDIFLQNKIKSQTEYLEKNLEYQACYCWRKQKNELVCGTETGDLSKSLLDLSFSPTTPSIMISRKAYISLNGFDETYKRHQDYEFLLRFFKKYKMGVVKEVLIELFGNEVNNQLYGKKLYDLKEYFFKQFNKDIEELDKKNPGYKKKVYAGHFSSACKDLLRKGNVFLAVKMYFNYGVYGGFEFWKKFFSIFSRGLKKKLKGN